MASSAGKRTGTSSSSKGGEDDSDDAVSLGPDEMMILDEEDYACLNIVRRGQPEETENKNTKKDSKDEVKRQRKVTARGKDIPKNETNTKSVRSSGNEGKEKKTDNRNRTESVQSNKLGKKQEPRGSGNSSENNDQELKMRMESDYSPIKHEDIPLETETDVKENSWKIVDVKPASEVMKKGENVNPKKNLGEKKSDTNNSNSSDDAVSLEPDEMMILDEEDYAYLSIVRRGQPEETENKNTKKDSKDEVKSQRNVTAPGKDIPKNETKTKSVRSSGNDNDQELKTKMESNYSPIEHEDIPLETEKDVKENSGKIVDVKPVSEVMKKGENVNPKKNLGEKKSDTNNSNSSGGGSTSKTTTQSSSIQKSTQNQGTASGSSKVSDLFLIL